MHFGKPRTLFVLIMSCQASAPDLQQLLTPHPTVSLPVPGEPLPSEVFALCPTLSEIINPMIPLYTWNCGTCGTCVRPSVRVCWKKETTPSRRVRFPEYIFYTQTRLHSYKHTYTLHIHTVLHSYKYMWFYLLFPIYYKKEIWYIITLYTVLYCLG